MDSFDVRIEYDSNDGQLYLSNNNSDIVSYTNIRDKASISEAITAYIANYIFNDNKGGE